MATTTYTVTDKTTGHQAEGTFTLAEVAKAFDYAEITISRTIERDGQFVATYDGGQVIIRAAQ